MYFINLVLQCLGDVVWHRIYICGSNLKNSHFSHLLFNLWFYKLLVNNPASTYSPIVFGFGIFEIHFTTFVISYSQFLLPKLILAFDWGARIPHLIATTILWEDHYSCQYYYYYWCNTLAITHYAKGLTSFYIILV